MTIDPFMEMLFRNNGVKILHRIFRGILGNSGINAARPNREFDLTFATNDTDMTSKVFSWFLFSNRSFHSTVNLLFPVTLPLSELFLFQDNTYGFKLTGLNTGMRLSDSLNNSLFFRRLSLCDHENKETFISWKHVKKVMPVKNQ